eukprot:5120263-Prymnesium_polylepis.2
MTRADICKHVHEESDLVWSNMIIGGLLEDWPHSHSPLKCELCPQRCLWHGLASLCVVNFMIAAQNTTSQSTSSRGGRASGHARCADRFSQST